MTTLAIFRFIVIGITLCILICALRVSHIPEDEGNLLKEGGLAELSYYVGLFLLVVFGLLRVFLDSLLFTIIFFSIALFFLVVFLS